MKKILFCWIWFVLFPSAPLTAAPQPWDSAIGKPIVKDFFKVIAHLGFGPCDSRYRVEKVDQTDIHQRTFTLKCKRGIAAKITIENHQQETAYLTRLSLHPTRKKSISADQADKMNKALIDSAILHFNVSCRPSTKSSVEDSYVCRSPGNKFTWTFSHAGKHRYASAPSEPGIPYAIYFRRYVPEQKIMAE